MMAGKTGLKERAVIFSQSEEHLIIRLYEDFKDIIMAKSNTAARARQAANKKKADMVKTGGGPQGPELTPAEELALANNRGRPIMQGLAGGSSSGDVVAGENPYVQVAGDSITLLQPPPNVLLVGEEEPTDANPAGPRPDPEEPGPSHSLGTGDGETDTEDVRTLYKQYLRAKIPNLHLSSIKLDLEVKLLRRQLNVSLTL